MANLRQGLRPWHKGVQRGGVSHIDVGQWFKKVGEVFKGPQPVLFGCLHDAVHHGAGPGSARRVGKQPVLPPANALLGKALGPSALSQALNSSSRGLLRSRRRA